VEDLERLLDGWEGGGPGGWIAGLHEVSSTLEWRLSLPAEGAGTPQERWWRPTAGDSSADPAGLRLGDLQRCGTLDVQVTCPSGPWQSTAASREANLARLESVHAALGKLFRVLRPLAARPRVKPPPGPAAGSSVDLRLAGVLRVLRAPTDPRTTIESLLPSEIAAVRRRCLRHGDELTRSVAAVLPSGPFTIPHEALEPLIEELATAAAPLDGRHAPRSPT